MHPYMTPDFAEQRRARLRKEVEAARLAAKRQPQTDMPVLGVGDVESIARLFEWLSWRST